MTNTPNYRCEPWQVSIEHMPILTWSYGINHIDQCITK